LAGSSHNVALPCATYDPVTNVGGGPYEIVSWIVNGVDIGSGSGSGEIIMSGSGQQNIFPTCNEFVSNMASAMRNVDPEGGWSTDHDGIAVSAGGCSHYLASSPQPEGRIYGPMQIRETVPTVNDEPRTWILFPTIV
jgi:hypothetical protein